MRFDQKSFFSSSLNTSKIILVMVIPYFLLAELLLYFELMPYIASIFEPFTKVLNLPPETALALAAGILLNLYAAIAFAAPLDLSVYDWTILGLFLGVLHSIPVESTIMKKLGISWSRSVIFRVVMAFIVLIPMILIPSHYLFDNPELIQKSVYKIDHTPTESFFDFMVIKTLEAITLSIEIIILITLVLFFTTLIKGLRFLKKFKHHLSVIAAMTTGVLIGITYGAGVLLKEAKHMTKQQVMSVCYFLMVAHALIEDTLLFVIFGADIVLLIGIRLFFAVLVFLLINLYYKAKNPI